MYRHRQRAFLGSLFLGCSSLLQAAPTGVRPAAVIDYVQMPAWLERQGIRKELVPGQALHNRDWVITEAGARIRLRLADESTVAVGADTVLQLSALGYREDGVFTAALDVPQGVIRFTSSPYDRTRQPRAVNVRVGTITASLRGTDLLGSANLEGDRVCVLKGSVAVIHPQGEAQQIDQPRQCYEAQKGSAPSPITVASAQQIVSWTALTNGVTASAVASRGGQKIVTLATVESEQEALAVYDRARAAGYQARIKPTATSGGGYHYSVRVVGLADETQ